MATSSTSQLKREVDIEGQPYMLTIDPGGLKLVPKGKRNGHWRSPGRTSSAAMPRSPPRSMPLSCNKDRHARAGQVRASRCCSSTGSNFDGARLAAAGHAAPRAPSGGVPVISQRQLRQWRSDFRSLLGVLQARAGIADCSRPKRTTSSSSRSTRLPLHHARRPARHLGAHAGPHRHRGNFCVLFTAHDAYMRDFSLSCRATHRLEEGRQPPRARAHGDDLQSRNRLSGIDFALKKAPVCTAGTCRSSRS